MPNSPTRYFRRVGRLQGVTGDSHRPPFSGSNIVNGAINIVLIVYAVFIVNHLSATQLKVFDNAVMRLAVVLLILGLAVYGHHASAILLTVAFVMSIQAANRSSIAKFANLAVKSNARETSAGRGPSNTVILVVRRVSRNPLSPLTLPARRTTRRPPLPSSPASQRPRRCRSAYLHHQGQSDAIQNNQVANNQGTEVRTWKEELGPQGLTQPAGFGGGDSAPASFDANTCMGGAAPMQ